ncbi:hypothetical protein PG994_003185 [Apiospora phragmitis]|uniref:Uncharacterized protein n=1 Tax=Apiospora phragmitis TaxID=2905665 RepID=A0ABR1VXE1_9PEZI
MPFYQRVLLPFPFPQQAILRLITGRTGSLPTFAEQPAYLSGFATDATLLWAVSGGEDDNYPWLDKTLRRLIGRMMARNYRDRPLLEDLLETASQAVRTRRASDYPGHEQEESDTAIRAFVDRFFFSA